MKKIVLISGCFAGGKSATAKEISLQKDLFIISFDTIKKFFTKYDRSRYKKSIVNIMFGMQDEMMGIGYTILYDGILLGDIRDRIKEKAKLHNYDVIEFNIEASLETTITRFRQRLGDDKKAQLISPANESEEHFIERFDFYQKNKNNNATTFSSDTLTPKEIANQIIKLSNI